MKHSRLNEPDLMGLLLWSAVRRHPSVVMFLGSCAGLFICPLLGREDPDVGPYGRHQCGCRCGDFRQTRFQAGSVAGVYDYGDLKRGIALRNAGGAWADYGDSGGQWRREVI